VAQGIVSEFKPQCCKRKQMILELDTIMSCPQDEGPATGLPGHAQGRLSGTGSGVQMSQSLPHGS
jgi:hypothetical protein